MDDTVVADIAHNLVVADSMHLVVDLVRTLADIVVDCD